MEDVTCVSARLLGLDGFCVLAQTEAGDGELHVLVETTGATAACDRCETRARVHQRRTVRVRDLPVAGRPLVVWWKKRAWRCPEPSCARKTWTETHPAIQPRQALSERTRKAICVGVGRDGHSVAEEARRYGVAWGTAMRSVTDYGAPLVEQATTGPAPVASLGIDEHRWRHGQRRRRSGWATTFVDVERGVLIDVVTGRSAQSVYRWLDKTDPDWRNAIRQVAIDPHRGYLGGVRRGLPHATVVLDPFHVVKLANDRVHTVRRRVQQDQLGHRGHKHDPLYEIRRLLVVGAERLDDGGWERIHAGLAAGDPQNDVAAMWTGKELVRTIYRSPNVTVARQQLKAFWRWAADNDDVPELVSLAHVLDQWQDELLAHFIVRISNGPTEATNLLIKKIKRVGHGFRRFEHYRLRLLLHCGDIQWQTQHTTRLRTRTPAFVA